jgi:hypothetical protein
MRMQGSASDWLCDEGDRQVMGRTGDWYSTFSFRVKENLLTHEAPPPKRGGGHYIPNYLTTHPYNAEFSVHGMEIQLKDKRLP